MAPPNARTTEPRDLQPVIEPMIPALRRYARSLVNERTAADDFVQDCLERAIRGWPHRRVDGDARTWLFTILHNVATNRLRQTTRHGPHVGLEDASDTAIAPLRRRRTDCATPN
jgi:RNA polymerase sigma-70 factor (ECF subfamily)